MTAALLQLHEMSVDIDTPQGRVPILRDLDLTLMPGERLGIVGESGSGKSMTALAIMGLLPDSATIRGQLALLNEDLIEASEEELCALRGNVVAMVFQEPMTALNPVQTIGAQIAEGPRLHLGLSRKEAMARTKTLLAKVGLPPETFSPNLYPHQLSGGQRQRVMIAIALASEPKLLIADEPTTALDATIQRDILDLIIELTHEQNMGLLIISHDLGVIARTTTQMAVMYAGRFVERGPTATLLSTLAHPYSRGLYRAMPQHARQSQRPARDRPRLPTIPGTVPNPSETVSGCAFANRCHRAGDICRSTLPKLTELAPTHYTACHFPETGSLSSEFVH
jgi:peptide/nickel transport system ATP-binding protein